MSELEVTERYHRYWNELKVFFYWKTIASMKLIDIDIISVGEKHEYFSVFENIFGSFPIWGL